MDVEGIKLLVFQEGKESYVMQPALLHRGYFAGVSTFTASQFFSTGFVQPLWAQLVCLQVLHLAK